MTPKYDIIITTPSTAAQKKTGNDWAGISNPNSIRTNIPKIVDKGQTNIITKLIACWFTPLNMFASNWSSLYFGKFLHTKSVFGVDCLTKFLTKFLVCAVKYVA